MATKLYLRNLVASIAPTTGDKSTVLPVGTGNLGGPNEGLLLDLVPGSAVGAGISLVALAQTAHQDGYNARFSSQPLAGGAYGVGTWTFGYNGTENNANANAFMVCSVYIWRPSTNSVVGFIYDSDTALGVELGNGVAATKFGQVPTFTGVNITAVDGDILVFEQWFHAAQGAATAFTDFLSYDGPTDPTNASTETSTASYINCPTTLAFLPPPYISRQVALRRPDSTVNVVQSMLRWQSDRLNTNDLGTTNQDPNLIDSDRQVRANPYQLRTRDVSTYTTIAANLHWRSDFADASDQSVPTHQPPGYTRPYQLFDRTYWNRLRPIVVDQSDQTPPPTDADPTVTHPPKQLPYQLYTLQSWQRLRPVVADQSSDNNIAVGRNIYVGSDPTWGSQQQVMRRQLGFADQSSSGAVDADPTVTRQLRGYSTPYQLYQTQPWQRTKPVFADASTLADTNIAGRTTQYIGSDPTWGSQQQVMRRLLSLADQSSAFIPDADPTVRRVPQTPYQLYDRTYWSRTKVILADQSDTTDPTTLHTPWSYANPYQLRTIQPWQRQRPTLVDQSDQGIAPVDADPTIHPPRQQPYQLYDRTYWNRLRPTVADQSTLSDTNIAGGRNLYVGSDATWGSQQQIARRQYGLADQSGQVVIPDADPTIKMPWAYSNPWQLRATLPWFRIRPVFVDQSTLADTNIAGRTVQYTGSDPTWGPQQQVQWRLHLADQSTQPAQDADPTLHRLYVNPYQLYDRTYSARPRQVFADASDQTALADPTVTKRLQQYSIPYQLYDRTYWSRIKPILIDQSDQTPFTPPPPQVFPPSGPGGANLGRRGPWYPDRIPEQVLREEEEIICII